MGNPRERCWMTTQRIRSLLAAGLLVPLLGGIDVCNAAPKPPVPDLTQGGTKDDKHDWTLGPTGARGWIWAWELESIDSRQILITHVDKGSPADGVLEVGDVILGVGGKPFADDARKAFGRAITEAEKAESEGILKLIRWRKGKQQNVQLELRVMGSYSDTAPWRCPKSQKILDAGCRYIAGHMKDGIDGQVNALALLASGKKEYLDLVRDYARRVGKPDLKLKLYGGGGLVSWHWGHAGIFLAEYYLATGDQYVLPAIREYAVSMAKGQSAVGSWGHGMAWPQANAGKLHGRLGGYGALNSAGLGCHLALVLAQKCGIDDPEVRRAIAKANTFFAFYVNKGSIPYGDHDPWMAHENNGKNSLAAIIFDLQGRREETRFFSRMTVASYAEREPGHTGNYFSFLWGALGANRAGPRATAAFLKELRWYYDLARRWDGGFPYQGAAGRGGSEHCYGGWDCTGAYILACALPLKKLTITGKGTSKANELAGDALREVVEAGRGFDCWRWRTKELFDHKTEAQLLADLASWSPAVRERAGLALAKKQGDVVPKLIGLLGRGDLDAQYGACQALCALKERGAPAVAVLTRLLSHRDVWLRIQAATALACIGKPARTAVPELLRLAVREDPGDPREFTQRYLCFCLFYADRYMRMTGLLAHSVEGVDPALLYPAVAKLLRNDDGRARAAISSLYGHLSYDEIRPLLPAICQAVVEPAPSGMMYASNIRLAGLKLLARHRIKEGIGACVTFARDQNPWASEKRTPEIMKILLTYGAAAKAVIPDLEALIPFYEKQPNFPAQLGKQKADVVRETIQAIKAAQERPQLRSLELAGTRRNG